MSDPDADDRKSRLYEIRLHVEQSRRSISEIVRFISIGYLFIFYFSITDDKILKLVVGYPYVTSLIGVSGALALIFDYINNIFREKSAIDAFHSGEAKYDVTTFFYRLASVMFYTKQYICLLGGIAAIYLFLSIGIRQLGINICSS